MNGFCIPDFIKLSGCSLSYAEVSTNYISNSAFYKNYYVVGIKERVLEKTIDAGHAYINANLEILDVHR